MPRTPLVAAAFLLACFSADLAEATPQFARRYRVDCSACHTSPPRLNQQGQNFVARGYRFPETTQRAPRPTIPLAVWNTFDLQHRTDPADTRGTLGRVELISGGTIGRTPLSYFVEWRAVSRHIGGDGRVGDRSGRFEDLFVIVPLDRDDRLTLTTGQFRALSQVDVSRRLGISEPLVFSAPVAGEPASSARLSALRAFSTSGRHPGARLMYHRPGGRHPADGWYSSVMLPLSGELSIPLAEGASFELEGRPKGVFIETYRQAGLRSIGGHLFVGSGRSLAGIVAAGPLTRRVSVLAALATARTSDASDVRYGLGGELFLTRQTVLGVRLDHRTGPQRDPTWHVYSNLHLPFGPPSVRQALRFQAEVRLGSNRPVTMLAVSHLF